MLLTTIRKRSREQWHKLVFSYLDSLQEWVRQHGELAAVCGFLLGVLIVLAFKLFLTIVVLIALIAFGVWCVALPENGAPQSSSDSGAEQQ